MLLYNHKIIFKPIEPEVSTNIPDIGIMNEVHQNYAREIMWTLDQVPKTLILNRHTYYLRGTIILNSGLRTGLRVASGH
jgi:hypothetical protein